jgi:hypothetical protein
MGCPKARPEESARILQAKTFAICMQGIFGNNDEIIPSAVLTHSSFPQVTG